MSDVKRILVVDVDDGVTWARLDRTVKTPEGDVEIYKFIEYYHSIEDALRDLYDVKEEVK